MGEHSKVNWFNQIWNSLCGLVLLMFFFGGNFYVTIADKEYGFSLNNKRREKKVEKKAPPKEEPVIEYGSPTPKAWR